MDHLKSLRFIDNFMFHVDFIVFKMEKDQDVPLILGYPFLATSGSLLDVKNECLILIVNDEVVVDMNRDAVLTYFHLILFLIIVKPGLLVRSFTLSGPQAVSCPV